MLKLAAEYELEIICTKMLHLTCFKTT